MLCKQISYLQLFTRCFLTFFVELLSLCKKVCIIVHCYPKGGSACLYFGRTFPGLYQGEKGQGEGYEKRIYSFSNNNLINCGYSKINIEKRH